MATDQAIAGVMDKIAKIRSLASRGGTQHEAETAAAKMAELLLRHNLSMADIDTYAERSNRRVTDENFHTGNRVWKQGLMHVLATAHLCQSVQHGNVVTVVGHDHNLIVVRETWYWLLDECDRLAESARVEAKAAGDQFATRFPRHWRNDFQNGFVEGIGAAYEKMRRDVEAQSGGQWGLVVVIENDVLNHVRQLFPKTKSVKSKVRITSGFARGYEDGSAVNLSKQVSGKHHESIPATVK